MSIPAALHPAVLSPAYRSTPVRAPQQGQAAVRRQGLTPSQTVGPYPQLCLPWADGADVVPDGTPRAFVVSGRVFDGTGDPVGDAVVESWLADPNGRFDPEAPHIGLSAFDIRLQGPYETVFFNV